MEQYKVIIHYHTGRRRGQIITIEGIEDPNIMEILGEITQDQLANAEIKVSIDGREMIYEDFIISFIGKRNAYTS